MIEWPYGNVKIDLKDARQGEFLEIIAEHMMTPVGRQTAVAKHLDIPQDYLMEMLLWSATSKKDKAMQILLTWVENAEGGPTAAHLMYAFRMESYQDLIKIVRKAFPSCLRGVKAKLIVSSFLFVFSCLLFFPLKSALFILKLQTPFTLFSGKESTSQIGLG